MSSRPKTRRYPEVGGQAVLGRQHIRTTPWLTERHGYDPTFSIIFRKTNRLDKALEYVKKAHELAPENEEISRTLQGTERAIAKRNETLKSAFSK